MSCKNFLLVAAVLLGVLAPARAQVIEISGSTSVVKEVVQPNIAAIREATGIEVKAYAMVTGRGMLALLQGKSALAAVSEPLEEAAAAAKKAMAEDGHPVPVPANLTYHEIGRERVGLYVHKDNPVPGLTRAQVKDLFTGKVRNWKQVGGPDLPVKVFLSSPGSATRALVQRQVLEGAEYVADAPEFRTAQGAMAEVAKERGGIAAAGLMLVEHAKVGNLKAVPGFTIERPLGLVSVGKPSEPAQKVIDFLRRKK